MLKICNPGLDRLGATHFLTFRNPYLGRDTYFGGRWIKESTPENQNAIAQTDTISTRAGSPKHHKLFEYAFQLNLNQSTIISRANTAVKHIKKKTLWLISPPWVVVGGLWSRDRQSSWLQFITVNCVRWTWLVMVPSQSRRHGGLCLV